GWSCRRLRVQAVDVGHLAATYEAPSFIATLDADEVLARCSGAGWLDRHRSVRGGDVIFQGLVEGHAADPGEDMDLIRRSSQFERLSPFPARFRRRAVSRAVRTRT